MKPTEGGPKNQRNNDTLHLHIHQLVLKKQTYSIYQKEETSSILSEETIKKSQNKTK